MKGSTSSNHFDFDTLHEHIALPHFAYLEQEADQRRSNKRYSVVDACKAGFAVYSLKSSSLLDFRPKAPAEEANLRACFGIENIPSDNGLRKILDAVPASSMRQVSRRIFTYLDEYDLLDAYRFGDDHLVVSIDGVHHYAFKKVKCPHCLEQHHRDGTVRYRHSLLSAALVCPGKSEDFVIDNEPIVRQDGTTKNDCERSAAKRLFASLSDICISKSIFYVLDALYVCAPIVKQITQSSPTWQYVINVKEGSHQHLLAEFDRRKEAGRVKWKKLRRKDGTYETGYTTDLEINASNRGVKTNLVWLNYRPKKGEPVSFSWMTNLEVTAATVMAITRIGRSRWKIENEVFNSLKNQQYNFSHNFGHGQQHLATNFAYPMMRAFTIDQLLQYGSLVFRSIWRGLKTKKAVWDAIRTVFKMVTATSIDDLCHKVLSIYQLQMIRV